MINKIIEIGGRCLRGGYMQRKVYPYGRPVTVVDMVQRWYDYDRCTPDTKAMYRAEMRGLEDTLTKWERYDAEGVKLVIIKTGVVVKFSPENVESLLETGLFRRVEE